MSVLESLRQITQQADSAAAALESDIPGLDAVLDRVNSINREVAAGLAALRSAGGGAAGGGGSSFIGAGGEGSVGERSAGAGGGGGGGGSFERSQVAFAEVIARQALLSTPTIGDRRIVESLSAVIHAIEGLRSDVNRTDGGAGFRAEFGDGL